MSTSEVYEFTFTWKIENFSRCFQKNREAIVSPVFSTNPSNGNTWLMHLYPRGFLNNEFISLFVQGCAYQGNGKEFNIKTKWELLVQETEVLCTKLFGWVKRKNRYCSGSEEFFELKKIHDKIKQCGEDKLIIRCHISRSESKLCNAITTICVDQYSFYWKVSKPTSSNWLESKKISIQRIAQFQIDITAPEDDVLIKITFDEVCSSSLFIKGSVSLLNVKGHKIETKLADYLFDSSVLNSSWQFPSFIKKSLLETEKNNIFKDGTFTLDWEFSYSNNVNSYGDYTASTIKMDFAELFKGEKHSDVKLRCNNVMLPAHKSILSARSPVFSAMFDHDMVENKCGIVEIDDCDLRILKLFLGYLYIDFVIIINTEIALKLLLMAEKYQVFTLKGLCISFLIDNLTDENVCEILAAADMVGHKHLKMTALNYIKTNPKKIFSLSKKRKWVESNPDLVTDIICNFEEK